MTGPEVLERQVFVPIGAQHLGATVTAPADGSADELVLLLAGTGAPRSHRFQLWTRTARALAGVGVASIRAEYLGIGDSTGRMPRPRVGDDRVDQAVAAAEFGLRATGAGHLAVVGNCSGGVVGLQVVARMPSASAAMLILPRLVAPSGVGRMVISARSTGLRSIPAARKVGRAVKALARPGREHLSPVIQAALAPAVDRADLLFVFCEDETDVYVEQSERALHRAIARMSAARRARVEVMHTVHGSLSGFENAEVQRETIDLILDWATARRDADSGARDDSAEATFP
jgi:predicted alpha/beta-hydrolase family hydrolase